MHDMVVPLMHDVTVFRRDGKWGFENKSKRQFTSEEVITELRKQSVVMGMRRAILLEAAEGLEQEQSNASPG